MLPSSALAAARAAALREAALGAWQQPEKGRAGVPHVQPVRGLGRAEAGAARRAILAALSSLF
jgi:hypothetical protein